MARLSFWNRAGSDHHPSGKLSVLLSNCAGDFSMRTFLSLSSQILMHVDTAKAQRVPVKTQDGGLVSSISCGREGIAIHW